MMYNTKINSLFVLTLSTFGAICFLSGEEVISVPPAQISPTQFIFEESKFSLQLPPKWQQEKDQEKVNKSVVCRHVNYNYSVWAEKSKIYAWHSQDGLLTIQVIKRDRTLGTGHFFDTNIRHVRKIGFTIHEKDVEIVDNERAKWWAHSYKDEITQYNALIPHLDNMLFVEFTTSEHSQQSLNEFKNLLKNIKFVS